MRAAYATDSMTGAFRGAVILSRALWLALVVTASIGVAHAARERRAAADPRFSQANDLVGISRTIGETNDVISIARRDAGRAKRAVAQAADVDLGALFAGDAAAPADGAPRRANAPAGAARSGGGRSCAVYAKPAAAPAPHGTITASRPRPRSATR